MSSYRECPSCRALLTGGQLSAGAGVCPYCGGKLTLDRDPPHGSDLDLENPYAHRGRRWTMAAAGSPFQQALAARWSWPSGSCLASFHSSPHWC